MQTQAWGNAFQDILVEIKRPAVELPEEECDIQMFVISPVGFRNTVLNGAAVPMRTVSAEPKTQRVHIR